MRQFTVHKSMGYDSNIHRLTSPRHKMLKPGSIIHLDMEAPNGNVWFIDEDGERGKIECGAVRNLTKDGHIMEMPYSTEIVREIWDDKHGDHFEVGPDRDCLNMVEIRYISDDRVIGGRLTFTQEQARLVAQAMIACADEFKIKTDH